MTLIARERTQPWLQTGSRAEVWCGNGAEHGLSRGMRKVARGLRRAGFVAAMATLSVVTLPAVSMAQDAAAPGSDDPVVLELYTAQGCASCPPADDMMLQLAGRDDVIALSLHVDYWDYIGWADSFADPEYAQRQQRYARRYGHSTIYTPQVVINGTDIMEGFRVMQVMESIAAHQHQAPEVTLELALVAGGGLQITAAPTADMPPLAAMVSRRSAMPNAVVGTLSMGDAEPAAEAPDSTIADSAIDEGSYSIQLVRYRAEDHVEIMGGENAGRTAQFANIVTEWQTVGSWDMMSPLDMTVPLSGDDPVVVIVQEAGQGEIVAAARLR